MTYADALRSPTAAPGLAPARPPRDGLFAVAVGLAVILAVVLTGGPFVDAPFNDDWSYAMTVRRLVDTGHLHYNGWATASLVAQAYWGAAWVAAAEAIARGLHCGPPPLFEVLRASTMPLAAAAVSLIYLLGRRAGLAVGTATLAALVVGWSPVYVPMAGSFMTDAPGLFCTMAALYALVRAAEADSPGSALRWLAVGVVVGGVGGTGRQIVWVVPLAVGPYVAWVRRGEPRFVAAAASGWVAVLGGAVATVAWFNRQPLTVPEPSPVSDLVRAVAGPVHFAANVTGLGLTLAWITLPGLWPAVVRRTPGRRGLGLAVAMLVAWSALLVARHHAAVTDIAAHVTPRHPAVTNPDPGHLWPVALPPWTGNTVDTDGVMPGVVVGGKRPVVLTGPIRLAIAVVVYTAVALLLVDLARWATDGGPPAWAAAADRVLRPPVGGVTVPALGLFAVAYLCLLLPRSARNSAFDRYLLPLMPCLLIPVLRLHLPVARRTVATAGAWAMLAGYALYAIATTQEINGLTRAMNVAAARLAAGGVPRTAVHGGFEFDSWTQLLVAGHRNDPRIHPRWYYRRRTGATPAVHPEYLLAASPASDSLDSEPTAFGDVPYFSLVPPFHRHVYINRYTDPWWLDPARAATRPAERPDTGLSDSTLPPDYDAPDSPVPPGASRDR